jgi:type I restriction enzyme R subunit
MPYTEFGLVEEPIVRWLQELGWTIVSAKEMRRDSDDPLDVPVLRNAIRKLNKEVVKSDDDVERVQERLRTITNDISGNREFSEWLKGERSIVLRQGDKAETIKLLDSGNIENNTFVVTNRFGFSGYEDVIFDIVLMVNGIPLVLMEAKKPTQETLDYHEAIRQLLRYHRVAPQFFKYLALTCATDGMSFRYDWVSEDKFFDWKDRKYNDPLEGTVKALFERSFFLDFICNFIVFEKEREEVRKKIAMYQQVSAANKIVSRVLEGSHRSGLVWHTQGSGKSLTMLFAAWKLKKSPELGNPTILLIVDRIDLERQLWGSFSNVDLPYTSKAESAKDLVSKLKQESREVIITTIQKFEDMEGVLSGRQNLIVFVDEAHRSQYGKLAVRMRQAFPNAFIFGFTGTPIDQGPLGKSTFRAFCPKGEIYLDKYSIKQSIEDGATVRLLWQARLPSFHIPKEDLDREFLNITADRSEEEQERILEKSAELKTALKAKDRIDKIAQDVADHYRSYIEPNGFKAQLAAVDREACALYKEALDKYLPSEYSTVIYTASPNDGELLRKYHMDKEDQIRVARIDFQKEGQNPKILIVTDMLLTGFDAPIEQAMYLDKPLRDHKLLQAIARTNRPYPGKEAGIIVDYVGIFDNLVKALNFQQEDVAGVAYDYDVLKSEFRKTIDATLGMFESVEKTDSRQSLFGAIAILENEDKMAQFKKGLSKLKALYETIAPDPFLFQYLDRYTWLIEVNEAFNKLHRRHAPDLSQYEEKTKQLIRDKLLITGLERSIPTFSIDKDYLKKIEGMNLSDDEKLMELRTAIESHIRINLEMNPIYETLSQRLERILKSKERSRIVEELKDLATEISAIEERSARLGLSKEEYAYLNAMKELISGRSENELIGFAKELTGQLDRVCWSGWQRKTSTTTDVEKAVFDACYNRFHGAMDMRSIDSLSQELMRFVMRYRTSGGF